MKTISSESVHEGALMPRPVDAFQSVDPFDYRPATLEEWLELLPVVMNRMTTDPEFRRRVEARTT